ncbi:MAG: hypothetical protein QM530_06435 [Phycisphaerales bacterium]|nr:hypothetical protein [Phycisphaerales bacterium]
MKKHLLLCILFFWSCSLFAQLESANLNGIFVANETRKPIPELELFFPKLRQIYACNHLGEFTITNIPYGNYTILIKQEGETIDSFKVMIDKAIVSLDTLSLAAEKLISTAMSNQALRIPCIALESTDDYVLGDEMISNQNISAMLSSSAHKDPYLNAVSYTFSPYNFHARGLSNSQQVWINGILMNNPEKGNAAWNTWSGLNDVFKNKSSSYGLASNPISFGSLIGLQAFDISASEQARQTKMSYSISNRSYNNRIMLTHSSGVQKNGWAFSISASRRWAQTGYSQGTFFDAYSCYASIAKILNEKHSCSFNVFVAPTTHARSGSATDEVYDLTKNHYYNANWGWQDGARRNAQISKTIAPIAILEHQYYQSEKIKLTTSFSFQTGVFKNSGLDCYDAIDPRADYYRNLPSYYASTNPVAASKLSQSIINNPELLQIDWTRMYLDNKANFETVANANGQLGNQYKGNRSLYVLSNDVEQLNKISIGSNLQYKYCDKLLLSAGAHYTWQQSHDYKQLEDLLGGDFFVNKNMFVAQQFIANPSLAEIDLNHPNRIVEKGDDYGYNYINTLHKTFAWGQMELDLKKCKVNTALQIGYTTYMREGLYKNGLFALNSYGRSEQPYYITYSIKSGIEYKINGRNYLFANLCYGTEEPLMNQVFISPRTRNDLIHQSTPQQSQSFEGGYFMKSPKVQIRVVFYAIDIQHSINIRRFYNDDPDYQSYVNFVMQNSNKRHIGSELGIEYCLSPFITLNAAANISQSYYTNRPKVSVFSDNDTNLQGGNKEVYINNYYLGIGPQNAYTIGISYNSKRYWFVKINANYFDKNYININPARRTVEAAELVEPNSLLFHKIFDQEKLPAFYTIDLSGGKSIRLQKLSKQIKNRCSLYLSLSISNLLNNQNIKSMGYEQLRYDFSNNNPDKFPSKYIYYIGLTFFANMTLKF